MTAPPASIPSPPVPQRRLKPEQRRAEILAAACELLLEEGFGALTLRNTAKRLGIAPGLVNHYFPVVEELAGQAFARIARGELDDLFATLAPRPDPTARIHALLAALIEPERRPVSLLWLDA